MSSRGDDVEGGPVPPRPRRRGSGWARPLVALLLAGGLLGLPAGPVAAQSVRGLLGALAGTGESDGAVSDEAAKRAIAAARDSFEHAARDRADRIVSREEAARLSRKEIEARIASEAEDFVVNAHERLVAARSDGLLSEQELSRALSEERELRLEALTGLLRAVQDGVLPPPERDDGRPWPEWIAAIARYTLLERNAAWRWGACLALLVAGLGLAGLSSRALARLAKRLGGRGASRTAGAAESLSGPFYLAAAAFAVRAALSWVWLPVGFGSVVRHGSVLLIAVALLWTAWRAADGVAGFLAWTTARTRGSVDDELVDVVRKGLRIGAVAGFAAFAVNALLGVELTSILATVGLIGIVASVAAQDTLRNVMAAFTVYGDRPFAVGDLVRIKDYFGNVEEIGFRSTRVRTLTGHRVVVPNAEVVREPVENVSARPSVRHHYSIDLVYSTPPDRVRRAVEILEEILTETDHPEDQPPRVSFEELAPYSLRLSVWYYSNTSDYWEARAHRTEVNLSVLERFREEELEFAFPTRSLYLRAGGAGSAREDAEEPANEGGEEEARAAG